MEWTEEEMLEYGLNSKVSCRKLEEDGAPMCPGTNAGRRQPRPCNVQHCAEAIYTNIFEAPEDGVDNTWGLTRIHRSAAPA